MRIFEYVKEEVIVELGLQISLGITILYVVANMM